MITYWAGSVPAVVCGSKASGAQSGYIFKDEELASGEIKVVPRVVAPAPQWHL